MLIFIRNRIKHLQVLEPNIRYLNWNFKATCALVILVQLE